MSQGPNGLTVLLEGTPRPRALVGGVVLEEATERETRTLLHTALPGALVVGPSIPWHRALASQAKASGVPVIPSWFFTQEVRSNKTLH